MSRIRPSFTCPICGRTSHHRDDVKNGYCGACHDFTGGITLEGWLAYWAEHFRFAVDHLPDREDVSVIVGVDDGKDAMLVGGYPEPEQPSILESQLNNFFGDAHTKRKIIAYAARIAWTPVPEPAPTEPSWLTIVVARQAAAHFAVRREQDENWFNIPADKVPWLALSTAASLRKLLETGEPILLKSVQHPSLFGNVTDPVPPEDSSGRI